MAKKIRRLQATIMLEFASLAQRRLQRFCNPSSFERVGSSPTGGSKILLKFYDMLELIKKWFESKFHVHDWEIIENRIIKIFDGSDSDRPVTVEKVYIQRCKICNKIRQFRIKL